MKKNVIRLICLIIVIGLIICSFIIYKNSEYKKTDAYKFKTEYESLNNTKNSSGKKVRNIEISKDNRIIYSSAKEIVEKIDKGETFVVYFGFASCPWCRSMITNLVDMSIEKKVDIYYVDVLEIRDTLELVDGKVKRTKEGNKYYMELLDRLDNVLSEYSLYDGEGKKVETNEKRIYAPNVVAIVNGIPEKLTEGISELLVDPYSELTDEMIKDSVDQLKCIFKCLNKKNICTKEIAC